MAGSILKDSPSEPKAETGVEPKLTVESQKLWGASYESLSWLAVDVKAHLLLTIGPLREEEEGG